MGSSFHHWGSRLMTRMIDRPSESSPSGVPENSFALMPDLRRRFPRPKTRWLWAWRVRYRIQAGWRWARIRKIPTLLLGPQYRRSRDLIEIDITYLCNLHCLNCNRSVTQARDAMHMTVDTVRKFVDESLAVQKCWRRIRVLGGEPTLHPQFQEILQELQRYKATYQDCILEVVTNGYGRRVQSVLAALPPDVMIDNSQKESPVQVHFGPFNLAPQDDPGFDGAEYKNGCAVLEECGMGLTPMGYYPCAVAGGIDRILGENLGASSLPADDDDMIAAVDRLCRLCGRFRDGHFIPRVLREPVSGAPTSPTWARLYAEWHARRQGDSKGRRGR